MNGIFKKKVNLALFGGLAGSVGRRILMEMGVLIRREGLHACSLGLPAPILTGGWT